MLRDARGAHDACYKIAIALIDPMWTSDIRRGNRTIIEAMRKVKLRVNRTSLPGRLRTKSAILLMRWWAVQDSNLRPPACKAGALTN
jgi:hypothetical protein